MSDRPFLPAATITENPELAVRSTRGRGYQWPPFAPNPDQWFRGASSVGKVIDKPWLAPWKVKLAAEAAADMRETLATVNKAQAITLVKSAAKAEADLAPARGSTLHDYAANQLAAHAGLQFRTVDVGEELDAYAANVTDWIDRHVVKVHAIERTVYVPQLRVAGTADAIVETATGVYGIDWKTKYDKRVDQITPDLGYAMQAWVLGNATHIAVPEQQELHELPRLSGFLVVYIASDGHVTYRVDIENAALGRLVTDAVAVLDGIDTVGTSVFGPPVRHLTNSDHAPAQVEPPVTA